jgi:hypothetical protein
MWYFSVEGLQAFETTGQSRATKKKGYTMTRDMKGFTYWGRNTGQSDHHAKQTVFPGFLFATLCGLKNGYHCFP